MVKTVPSKALITRINLVVFAVFLVLYATVLLSPASSDYLENAGSLVRCPLHDCHHRVR